MTLSLPFHFSAAFVIMNARASVEIKSDKLNPSPYVSFTGTLDGAGGQIVDSLRKLAGEVPESVDVSDIIELCDAWDALHLKEFAKLSPLQIAYLDSMQTTLILLNGERYGGRAEFEDIGEADFSNATDVIDSRDVIRRIEELKGAFEGAGLDFEKLDPKAPDYDAQGLEDAADAHERAEELRHLLALESEAEGYSDWIHGATLIHKDHFTDYAKQLAEDIGAIDRNASWPLQHIDWVAAANALKVDYTEVKFDGITYFVR